jgi:hypothetical protein
MVYGSDSYTNLRPSVGETSRYAVFRPLSSEKNLRHGAGRVEKPGNQNHRPVTSECDKTVIKPQRFTR